MRPGYLFKVEENKRIVFSVPEFFPCLAQRMIYEVRRGTPEQVSQPRGAVIIEMDRMTRTLLLSMALSLTGREKAENILGSNSLELSFCVSHFSTYVVSKIRRGKLVG